MVWVSFLVCGVWAASMAASMSVTAVSVRMSGHVSATREGAIGKNGHAAK